MRTVIGARDVRRQLGALGVRPGDVLLVHSAFSRIGPIEGGPTGLIHVLLDVLGPDGTLVMPSMTDDDDAPFDVRATPCRALGVVPDTFRQMQGVLRSDNPHAFAAAGRHAPGIVAPHAVDEPHGPGSPVARALAHDARVLLLGVGHDANTTIHLAEHLAAVRYRRAGHATVIEHGEPTRVSCREPDHCCALFGKVDAPLDAGGGQRRGPVGHAEARLNRSRDVVEAALALLRADETAFLHPAGTCGECDLARGSLGEALVVLLVGPKGAGKSTLCAHLEREAGVRFVRVEPIYLDVLRAHEALRAPAVEAIGFDAIFDAVDRAAIRYGTVCFESTGAAGSFPRLLDRLRARHRVVLVRVDAPGETCVRRVRDRDAAEHVPVSDDRVREINAVAATIDLPFDLRVDNDGSQPAPVVAGHLARGLSIWTARSRSLP